MFVKVCPELGYKTVKRLRRFLCGCLILTHNRPAVSVQCFKRVESAAKPAEEVCGASNMCFIAPCLQDFFFLCCTRGPGRWQRCRRSWTSLPVLLCGLSPLPGTGDVLSRHTLVRCDYALEESVFGKGKIHQLAPCPDSFSGPFQGTGLGDVFSLFRIVAKNRAQSLGTIENRFFHSFWGNCPPVCHSSSIREPSVITSPPMMVLALAGSPRKRMDRKMVMATLSLSMGATLETSPNCRALK